MLRPIAVTPIATALVNALLGIALPANAQVLVLGAVKQAADAMARNTALMATLLNARLLTIIVISIATELMILVVIVLALLLVFASRTGTVILGAPVQERLR